MQSSSSVLKNSCETSQSDIAIQLASNNLAIGFSSNSIAVRLKNPGCKIVPLEVTLSRPIYYVTQRYAELSDRSFLYRLYKRQISAR